MRYITEHNQHIYTAKASAMRAARNVIDHRYLVEMPELRNRFDGYLAITADMISVEPFGEGWRWSYTYHLADVLVRVRYNDGTIAETRYAEVAHWKDAVTPCDEKLRTAALMMADYLQARESAQNDEQRHEIYVSVMPNLLLMCQDAGVDYGELAGICRFVELALASDNPSCIAEAIVRAEPFGLASASLRSHLLIWAARRGATPDVYLRMAENALVK